MDAHCSVRNYGAVARGRTEEAAAAVAAGSSVLFRPAPQVPAPATGLPHAPSHYGLEGFYCGPMGSDAEQSILEHEMVDPRSMIHDPLFSGPPPERPENPMIHDPLFGKALPIDGLILTTLCPASAWAKGRDPDSGEFCAAPPVIRMEVLVCLDGDRRRRRVAASA